MARICYDYPYINVSEPSVLQEGSTTAYQPAVKLGTTIRCDSGVYRYLQANGATREGGASKFLANGAGTDPWDATPLTTAISGAVPADVGICVSRGGLADNQQGWFWLGAGEDYVFLAGNPTSLLPLGTTTSAGVVGLNTLSGDLIADLIAIDSSSATGLRLCRSHRLLATNYICSTQ